MQKFLITLAIITSVTLTALGAYFSGGPLPFHPSAAQAQTSSAVEFIRDAEIEHYLRALATPIYNAAGIDADSVSILVVKSSTINAFVAGGMNEFFYTGLLQLTDTPEQLAGVIAHETGHIAGGHLIRGSEAMANATTQAIIGMVLGAAAGIASGNGQVAMGALSGANQIAERNFLSYSRTQESSADAAGMSYLDKIGVTTQGMKEFMQKLAGQELLPADRQAAYVRTHPLTQERIDNISHHLEQTGSRMHLLAPEFKTMHERMKAKLMGFLQPETALLRYTDKDPRLPARYARAIALYQTSQLLRALNLMNGLLSEEPHNPFFIELKAQMLFENGHVDEAINLYAHAVELLPDQALLRIEYAHALLEGKSNANIDIAITQLTEANRLETDNADTWRYLASAWGRKADLTNDKQFTGLVAYALAEEALAKGVKKEARQYADRALKILPKSTPYWTRAQDIKLSTEKDADH